MNWLLSFLVFSAIVTGVFSQALAGKTGEESKSHDGGHHIGVTQPLPVPKLAKIPGTAQILEPKALSKIAGNSVTLKWQGPAESTVFHVQVATDPRFKWLVKEDFNVSGTTMQLGGLEAKTFYYWRVAARNPGNDVGTTKGAFAFSSFETQ